MSKILHLEGQQFGYLTVIKKSDKKYNSGKCTKTLWDCRCVCGKETQVDSGSLLSGNTRSCGCMKNKYGDKKHELGKKYGKLTVINVDNYYDDRKVTCQCECGTIKKFELRQLKHGHIKSCGCLKNVPRYERGFIKDEVGNVYGKLTVIAYDSTKKNSVYWKCKCECGNEVVVSGGALRSGNTRSCGCARIGCRDKKAELERRNKRLVSISVDNICYYRDTRSKPSQDLKGKKFGKLTVIDWVIKDIEKSNDHAWLCRCDCGNTTFASVHELTSGHKKSCGCYLAESLANRLTKDITGKRFGMLTAIKRVGKNKNGVALWLCQCDCGNTHVTSMSSLNNKNTQSCGCISSAGEYYIKHYLLKNKIPFDTQCNFDDCTGKNGGLLRFDFGIKDADGNLLCLLEYDGEQHFKVTTNPWDSEELLKKRQLHDEIKNNYCKEHDIPLIRISYKRINDIKKSDTYLLSLIAPYIEVAA